MKLQLKKAETSVILIVFIQDSSSTTGAGLGSLDQTSSIVGGYVKRNGTGVALAVDENVTTEGTYQAPSTAAQVRIGTPANMTTGVYEFHFHNDLFTTADYLVVSLGGASNMAPLLIEIQLTDVDLNTATTTMRGTDNALLAASAPTNFDSMGINSTGNVAISWGQVGSATATVGLSNTTIGVTTVNSDMRGTDLAYLASSARAGVTADIVSIDGNAISGTGSQLADGFSFWYDVATPAKTMNDAGVPGTSLAAADVWNYDISGITTTGSAGEVVNDIQTNTTGNITANVTQWGGQNVAAHDTSGYPVVTIKDGAGQGEINTLNGQIVNVGAVNGSVNSVIGPVGSVAGNVDGTINGFTAPAKVELQAETSAVIVAMNLDHLMKQPVSDDEDMSTEVIDGTVLAYTMTGGGSLADYVAPDFALQSIRERGDAAWITFAGGSTSASVIAERVWVEDTRTLTANTNLENLEVDVTKLAGSALSETSDGNIALNFGTFYDNADALTIKTVDDVGGGSATIPPSIE